MIRPLHGQASWIGDQVPVHDDPRLLRSAALADAAVSVLGQGNGLLLRGNGALTCGASPDEAVTRMWLLAAACEVWLSAAAAGQPRELSADEVATWQAAGRELLPRLWQHLSRNGPAPGSYASLTGASQLLPFHFQTPRGFTPRHRCRRAAGVPCGPGRTSSRRSFSGPG